MSPSLIDLARKEREDKAQLQILSEGFWSLARQNIRAQKDKLSGYQGFELDLAKDSIANDRKAYAAASMLRTRKIAAKAVLNAYGGKAAPELYEHEAELYQAVLEAVKAARSATGGI